MDDHKAALRQYFQEFGVVPPLSVLARLWGFASKSAASRRVEAMVQDGTLERAPNRRLRPGPALLADPEQNDPVPSSSSLANAERGWANNYEPDRSKSFGLVARLLHLARSIEAGVAETAASEGLSSGESHLLDALFRLGPPYRASPTALKGMLLLSLGGIARRVDRLVTLGLVDRISDDLDGRSLLVQLNDRGIDALQRMVTRDDHSPHITWATSLTAEDRDRMTAMIDAAQEWIDNRNSETIVLHSDRKQG